MKATAIRNPETIYRLSIRRLAFLISFFNFFFSLVIIHKIKITNFLNVSFSSQDLGSELCDLGTQRPSLFVTQFGNEQL